MAIKTQSGYIVKQDPQSITQQSMDQGTGTPSSPLGAKTVGGNEDQAKMAGTPAQTQNAQQVRREVEQPQTLTSRERYEKAAGPTDAQAAAKDKAQTLSTLGPVRTRVESLIQQRIAATQQQDATTLANQAAIDALPEEQRPQAQDALNNYLTNPTEENLQAFYDVVGRASLEGGGIEQYVQGGRETIAGLAQEQLAGEPTIGDLDVTQLGTSLEDMANALGVTAEEVAAMNLDQLDAAIDFIESQEFSQVDQLRSQLADPTLPMAARQQVLQQLSQLGAAGMPGAVEAIDRLDEQIQTAQEIEFMGQSMSLEDALSDEGISALIGNAVLDPEILEKMKEDPNYAGLGNWIEENKEALETMVGELESDVSTFIDVQDRYQQLKESLGSDGADLLQDLLGTEFTNSILAGNLDKLQEKAESSTIYNFLKDNEVSLGQAKTDPEFLEKLKDMEAGGFDVDSMESAVELSDDLKDPSLAALAGTDSMPTTLEELERIKGIQDIYESLDPSITSTLTEEIRTGEVDLGDLQAINESDYADLIIEDIKEQRMAEKRLDQIYHQEPDDLVATKKMMQLDNVNYADLQYTMLTDSDAAAKIAAIFDQDGDGQVSQDEWTSPRFGDDVAKKYKSALGLGADLDSIIESDGRWDWRDNESEYGMSGKIPRGWQDKERRQLGEKIRETQDAYAERIRNYETQDIPNEATRMLGDAALGKSVDELMVMFEKANDKVNRMYRTGADYNRAKKVEEEARKKYIKALNKIAGVDFGRDGDATAEDEKNKLLSEKYQREYTQAILDQRSKYAEHDKLRKELREAGIKDDKWQSFKYGKLPQLIKNYRSTRADAKRTSSKLQDINNLSDEELLEIIRSRR